MGLGSKLNSEIRRMSWVDICFIEWCNITLGILLAILIPRLTDLNPWLVLAVFLVLAAVPLTRVVKRNR